MALPANWFFGGRNPLEGVLSPFGGFNLGNIQPVGPFNAPPSTVSTPTAGVSGTPAGQPSGGMDALRTPVTQPTDGGASDSAGPAAPSGRGFSVGEAASTANRGGSFGTGLPNVPGLVDSSVPGLVSGAGKVASLMGFANPLAMAALPFGITNSLTGHIAGSMGDPAIVGIDEPSIATGNPSASPIGTPAVGNVNTTLGRIIAAIQASNDGPKTDTNSITGATGFGGNGSSVSPAGGIFGSLGNQTGNVAIGPGSTEISGIAPQVTSPDPTDFDGPAVPADAPSPTGDGPAAGPAGQVGDGTAGGIGGSAPGGEGGDGGAAGAAGGGASGGGDGAMRRGGRVAKRPDPRRLAAMLKSGARVPVGNPRSNTDDVPVKLERNEIVMNRPAARAHAHTLDLWNQAGRRQMDRTGGFAVGQPREARR